MHSWAVLCKSLSRLRLTNSGIPDLEKFAELFVGLHLLLRKKDSSFVTFVVVISKRINLMLQFARNSVYFVGMFAEGLGGEIMLALQI